MRYVLIKQTAVHQCRYPGVAMAMKNVLIVNFGNTGNEPEALRQILESFDYCVFMKHIGRPNDFIDVLKGRFPIDPDCIILSCHGKNGNISMPVLADEVYEKKEPRGDFSCKEINKYNTLHGKLIISLGCATGEGETAAAFSKNGNTYIAPGGYIDGKSALFFTVRFFYEISRNKKSIDDAYISASETDSETELFVLARFE